MERSATRRHLRLKEWTPSNDRLMRPTTEYLAGTDGSLRDVKYRVRTDADGYILPPAPESTEAAESAIFFGDSFVESVYVSEGQRFPAAVEQTLRRAGMPVRCLNAGYSGATTLHMLMALIGKVGRRPATTIVLVVPSNDVLALIKKGGFWCREDKRYSPVIPVPETSEAQAQPFDLADLQATLNLFVDACRRFRMKLVLATFPHRVADFGTDPWLPRRFRNATNYARMLGWRRSANAVTRAIANRLGLPLVDLEGHISEHPEWFYDDLHMNEAGSARVAQLLADALIAQRQPASVQ